MSNFWEGKNVFVTGCTGLMGSWITKELVEQNAKVTGLVRDQIPETNFKTFQLDKKINIVSGDIEDYNTLRRALAEYEIDTVFHLAAQPIVGIAFKDPMGTFKANIMGTANVLEACRQSNVERVAIASSDKAYGEHSELPYTEEFSLNGRYPYDASKSCADILSQTYYKTYGLPVAITRCGNTYGGGDLNFNRIIPETIKSILHEKNPIIRSDGKFVREYFYIKDVVTAYLQLAENLHRPEVKGEAFNFGSEEPVTVVELVKKILEISGKQHLNMEILNSAKAEITKQYLSAEKAKSILGWKPEFTLDVGLKETYDWYKNYFNK